MNTGTRTIICSMLVALTMAGGLRAQSENPSSKDFPLSQKVSVDYEDIPLRDALRYLSEQTSVSIVSEEILGHSTLTILVKDVSVLQLLTIMERILPGVSVEISAGSGFMPLESMQNVSETELAEAVNYKKGTKVIVLFKYNPGVLTVEDASFDPDEEVDRSGAPGNIFAKQKTQTSIYNLSPMLKEGSRKTDNVAAALQTAWEMIAEEVDQQMTYHEETNLLMLKGSKQALQIADQIVGQMPEGEHIVMQSILFRQNTGSPEFVKVLSDMLEKREKNSVKEVTRNLSQELRAIESQYNNRLENADRRCAEISNQKEMLEERSAEMVHQITRLEAELKEAAKRVRAKETQE